MDWIKNTQFSWMAAQAVKCERKWSAISPKWNLYKRIQASAREKKNNAARCCDVIRRTQQLPRGPPEKKNDLRFDKTWPGLKSAVKSLSFAQTMAAYRTLSTAARNDNEKTNRPKAASCIEWKKSQQELLSVKRCPYSHTHVTFTSRNWRTLTQGNGCVNKNEVIVQRALQLAGQAIQFLNS